jgi:hypothetical protein
LLAYSSSPDIEELAMPLDIESYAEPEVAVAAVVVAAAVSPPVRRSLRKGLVYGLAGLLVAGDKVAAAASGVAGGVRRAVGSGNGAPAEVPPPAPASA